MRHRIQLLGIAVALLLAIGADVCKANTNYYLRSVIESGRVNPPLPMNPKPGYPLTLEGIGWVVEDQIPDAQVLARGVAQMDSGGPTPPGWDEEGGDPTPPDTNAWMGTWVRGLRAPPDGVTGWPTFVEPCLWTILCTNNDGSQLTHFKKYWAKETKVCPNDMIYILWPIYCATNQAGWPTLLVSQRGTNQYGQCVTNELLALMDNPNHTVGNWAAFTIPAWPEDWYDPNNIGNCTNSLMGEPGCCPPASGATNIPIWLIKCPANFDASIGPGIGGPGGGTGENYPNTPILIERPPSGDDCPWKSIEPVTDNWPAHQGENPQGSCFSLPQEPKKPDWYPPYLPPYWPHDLRTGLPSVQTQTPDPEVMSNTVYVCEMYLHGLPGVSYRFQSSTNLVNWVAEGSNNVVLNDGGWERIILGTKDTNTITSKKFFRVIQSE